MRDSLVISRECRLLKGHEVQYNRLQWASEVINVFPV